MAKKLQTKPTPPKTKPKNQISPDPHAEKLSWEIISNTMAKQANGEVLRWDYNQANGELIVLLVDGRKFHSFFDKE